CLRRGDRNYLSGDEDEYRDGDSRHKASTQCRRPRRGSGECRRRDEEGAEADLVSEGTVAEWEVERETSGGGVCDEGAGGRGRPEGEDAKLGGGDTSPCDGLSEDAGDRVVGEFAPEEPAQPDAKGEEGTGGAHL